MQPEQPTTPSPTSTEATDKATEPSAVTPAAEPAAEAQSAKPEVAAAAGPSAAAPAVMPPQQDVATATAKTAEPAGTPITFGSPAANQSAKADSAKSQTVAPAQQQASVTTTGFQPADPKQATSDTEIKKVEKQSLYYGIGGILILFAGMFFGFASLLGVAVGVYAIRIARPLNYTPGFLTGILAIVMNSLMFLIALMAR